MECSLRPAIRGQAPVTRRPSESRSCAADQSSAREFVRPTQRRGGRSGDTKGMVRRTALGLAAVLGLTAPLTLLLSSTASAVVPLTGATSGTATVHIGTDAWYSASAACTSSPAGCLPAGAPAPYSAKTLHVGVAAGQEESRTYLSLDLAALPAGTALTGGT